MKPTAFRPLATALTAAIIFAGPAFSQSAAVRVPSALPVDEAVARMSQAIEGAGARVFTTVNYAEGARSVGGALRPTTVIIFGGPQIGAAVFEESQTIGLYLPLRVLAYEDAAGEAWLLYDDPADAAAEHGIPEDHPAILNMKAALERVTSVGSGS